MAFFVEDSISGGVWCPNYISLGKNQAICKLTYDQCQMYFDTMMITPQERGPKLEHGELLSVVNNLGYVLLDKRTNQDKRDATMVAIAGINKIKQIEQDRNKNTNE